MSSWSDYVIVVDLDDTLYLESDYVASGKRYVYQMMQHLFSCADQSILDSLFANEPHMDFFGSVCKSLFLPDEVKKSILWAYRLHTPDIRLALSVKNWLSCLENKCRAIAILTDGRSITQRLKIKSLQLERFPVYISEEWGTMKPDPTRFESIEKQWGDARYVYIGDNPAKDFIAPNALNWTTIGLLDQGYNIHKQNIANLPGNYLPQYWINSIIDTEKVLINLD